MPTQLTLKLSTNQHWQLSMSRCYKTFLVMGKFEYESGDTKFKGAFNVYQARNGAIMLLMGTKVSALTYSQINDLNINCYELADFNHDDFKKYYLSGSENVL